MPIKTLNIFIWRLDPTLCNYRYSSPSHSLPAPEPGNTTFYPLPLTSCSGLPLMMMMIALDYLKYLSLPCGASLQFVDYFLTVMYSNTKTTSLNRAVSTQNVLIVTLISLRSVHCWLASQRSSSNISTLNSLASGKLFSLLNFRYINNCYNHRKCVHS